MKHALLLGWRAYSVLIKIIYPSFLIAWLALCIGCGSTGSGVQNISSDTNPLGTDEENASMDSEDNTATDENTDAQQNYSFEADSIFDEFPVNSHLALPSGDVLKLAKSAQEADYNNAIANGAQIISVDEGRSFIVWWEPDNFNPETDTVVVSLHGHAAWATRDFTVWNPHVSSRNYAYLGIQWWFGRSQESVGYYQPNMIYGLIRDALREHGIKPGNVIFQGFSMGSANSYAVSAFDIWEGDQYFAVNIANAGAYESDFLPNAKIETYSNLPFKDAHWILYCAGLDEDHPTSCDDFHETSDWLETNGAGIDLFIQDADGTHGSFMVDKTNVSNALNLADKIIEEK